MSKLLVRPHKHSNECIASYLIRVSQKNGFNHLGLLLQHAGLPWKNLRAPIHQMINGEYDTETYFASLGLQYSIPRTAITFSLSKSPSFTTKIFVKTPKICPECLAEDGYCHDIWAYTAYTACTKHKLMLVDTNPVNGKQLSWYRGALDKFSINDSHPITSQLKASTNTIVLSRAMASLIENRKLPKSTPAVLRDLNFPEALSLIHFIAHYQFRLFHSTLFTPASLDNLSVSQYYTEAWKTLKQWPKHFHFLLSQYIDRPMSERGQSGINKHFRDIHERLHRQRGNKGIDLLRAAFDQYIDINWPNAIQTNRLTRISISSGQRPLINQKEAQHILNCREPRIHSLIAQCKITPHQFKGKIYFNRDEINALNALYQDNWTMAQAVSQTELSRYQLKQLLDAGLIKTFQKADHHNRDWLISKHGWQMQIENLRKYASESAEPGYSLCGLQKQGLNITDVVRLLTARKLRFSFHLSTEKPLSFKQFCNYKRL
jgi:hypothetical protein